MTKEAFDKIAAGLKDAIDGNWASVTFVDMASGPDWSAVQCPKCLSPNRWREQTPTRCAHCGVRFKFT